MQCPFHDSSSARRAPCGGSTRQHACQGCMCSVPQPCAEWEWCPAGMRWSRAAAACRSQLQPRRLPVGVAAGQDVSRRSAGGGTEAGGCYLGVRQSTNPESGHQSSGRRKVHRNAAMRAAAQYGGACAVWTPPSREEDDVKYPLYVPHPVEPAFQPSSPPEMPDPFRWGVHSTDAPGRAVWHTGRRAHSRRMG
jgi:hypothetical protein